MDTRLLNSFIQVAECLSFTEASKRLYISQSTLSHQIFELERELGVRLLQRNKRSVQLTQAGLAFLKDAYALVEQQEQAVRHLRQIDAGSSATLSVGYLSGPFQMSLPRIIKGFLEGYSSDKICIQSATAIELRKGLISGAYDVVFTALKFPLIEGVPDGELLTTGSDSTQIVMSSSHPLAGEKSIAIEQLCDERFIILDRGAQPYHYQQIVEMCMAAGFFPRVGSFVRYIWDLFMLVDSNMGVTLAAGSMAQAYSGSVVTVPITGHEDREDVGIAWRRGNENPLLPEFIKAAKGELLV